MLIKNLLILFDETLLLIDLIKSIHHLLLRNISTVMLEKTGRITSCPSVIFEVYCLLWFGKEKINPLRV